MTAVMTAAGRLAKSPSVNDAEALQQAVQLESGIPQLEKRLAELDTNWGKGLTVYKELSALQDEAVSILEGLVRAEAEKQTRAEELSGMLTQLHTASVDLPSLRVALSHLQTARAHLEADEAEGFQHSSLASDESAEGAEPTPLVVACQTVLVDVRNAIAGLPLQVPPDVEEALRGAEKMLDAAKTQAIKTGKENKAARRQAIAGLEAVQRYLEDGGHPPLVFDVAEKVQESLDDRPSKTRMKQLQELLETLRHTREIIQAHVVLFEKDVLCLCILSASDLGAPDDKAALERLFGRYGTDLKSRLGVERPEAPDVDETARKTVLELNPRWARKRPIRNAERQVYAHALQRLASLYEYIGDTSAEEASQHEEDEHA